MSRSYIESRVDNPTLQHQALLFGSWSPLAPQYAISAYSTPPSLGLGGGPGPSSIVQKDGVGGPESKSGPNLTGGGTVFVIDQHGQTLTGDERDENQDSEFDPADNTVGLLEWVPPTTHRGPSAPPMQAPAAELLVPVKQGNKVSYIAWHPKLPVLVASWESGDLGTLSLAKNPRRGSTTSGPPKRWNQVGRNSEDIFGGLKAVIYLGWINAGRDLITGKNTIGLSNAFALS